MTRPLFVTDSAVLHFIKSSLSEDIGEGDHTTIATIPANQKGEGVLKTKQGGIIAGVDLVEKIFQFVDSSLIVERKLNDGEKVFPGDVIFNIKGSIQSILSTERLALNCMQRMSGIATYTNKLVKLIEDTGVKIKDTRKTTPNFRLAEKWAVWIGGGHNHRFALYDMIMIKDNHIDACGGILEAIAKTKEYLELTGKELKIEVEARTLEDVEKTISTSGVEVIMLDNMSSEMIKKAVLLVAGKCKLEASGGITEQNLVEIASTGVDYISIGALTHSIKSLDMNLKLSNTSS